jgi:hypothetical protein
MMKAKNLKPTSQRFFNERAAGNLIDGEPTSGAEAVSDSLSGLFSASSNLCSVRLQGKFGT